MRGPNIISSAPPYIFRWEEPAVMITIDRVDDGHRGVTGEITIETYPKLDHIWQSRFNFTSLRARPELAKLLRQRVPEIDCLLEELCCQFLKILRQGEPVIEVGNRPRRAELDYRLKPIIFKLSLGEI